MDAPAAVCDESSAEQTALQRRGVLFPIALTVFVVCWFATLGAHALFNPDEGRYAEIPREMLATGQWLVPHLNDLVYIEKPPLQYWATAATFAAFGLSDWSARLYTGLCGLLTVLVAAALASTLGNASTAWRAGIVGGSSLLMVLMGHQLTLDMSLTFFMTAALAAFIVAQNHRAERILSRRWMWVAWVCVAAGILTKGLEAFVLPLLALAAYSVLQRDRAVWKHLHPLSGLVLVGLIAAPWFIQIQRVLPTFFNFFFVREHFQRYLTQVEQRYEPWWFFGMVLVAGSLPWVVPVVRALFTGWRANSEAGTFDARRLLWVSGVVVIVFFSASDSKLVPYILPIFPALAVLVATADTGSLRRDVRLTGYGLIIGGLACLATAIWAHTLAAHGTQSTPLQSLSGGIAVVGAILVVGGAVARRVRHDLLFSMMSIGGASFLALSALLVAAQSIAPFYSGKSLTATLSAHDPSVPVYSVRTYDQSIPFYLQRPVTLVEARGELDFGLRLEPRKGIDSLEEFARRWQSASRAYAILEPETYSVLQKMGLPMRVVSRNPQRLLVSRDLHAD